MTQFGYIEKYKQRLQKARDRFLNSEAVGEVKKSFGTEEKVLPLFIFYKVLNFQVHRSLGEWMRKASFQCYQMNLPITGETLGQHSHYHDSQNKRMGEDLDILVKSWNQNQTHQLKVQELVEMASTPGVRLYWAALEQAIDSEEPYGHLAIQYEDLWMLNSVGIPLYEACVRKLKYPIFETHLFVEAQEKTLAEQNMRFESAITQLIMGEFSRLEGLVKSGIGTIMAQTFLWEDCLGFATRLQSRSSAAKNVSKPVFRELTESEAFFDAVEKIFKPVSAKSHVQDKRKSRRFPVDLRIYYRFEEKNFLWKEGRALDICREGIKLSAKDEMLPQKTNVEIKLRDPRHGCDLFFSGRVVWSRASKEVTLASHNPQERNIVQYGISFQ